MAQVLECGARPLASPFPPRRFSKEIYPPILMMGCGKRADISLEVYSYLEISPLFMNDSSAKHEP